MSVISVSVATRGTHPAVQQQADLVDHHQLARVRQRDRQPSVFQLLQRNEVEAEHQLHRNLAEELMLNLESLQLDILAAIAARQFVRPLLLVVCVRNRLYKKLLCHNPRCVSAIVRAIHCAACVNVARLHQPAVKLKIGR